MRGIKFRGKRLDNDEWCYGSLLIWADGECIILEKSDSSYDMWKREINPDTVGQFTGLYDREGNEIFEGDVVTGLEYADFHTGDDGNVNAVVVWDTEWASFMLDAGCRVNIRPCADIRRRIRVTGNIHDNPSLLEGGLKCFTL